MNNELRMYQGHPTDCFGRIYVRKTCNRLNFSVREMSSRAFLFKINESLLFSETKMTFLAQKRSARIFGKEIRPKVFGKWTKKKKIREDYSSPRKT